MTPPPNWKVEVVDRLTQLFDGRSDGKAPLHPYLDPLTTKDV